MIPIAKMDFKIKKAAAEDRQVLDNLMQYYVYDFSEFLDFHVNQSGRFGDYPLDNYWLKKTHFPYLLEVNGSYAGFALVNFKESEDKAYFTIAEFFIMKKYRKNGFGKAAAYQIFNRFRGEWEILQVEKNIPAQAFWRKVVGEYTNGGYTERTNENGSKIQEFNNLLKE